MPKVLVLTNDFPPRPGGIQFFVHALATVSYTHLTLPTIYSV